MIAHARTCGGFWLYALAGGLVAFSALSAAIGLLTALPAVLALALATRVARGPGAPLGLVTGVGLLCVAVAILNARDVHGPDATAWAAAGAVLVLAGVLAYCRVLRRRGP